MLSGVVMLRKNARWTISVPGLAIQNRRSIMAESTTTATVSYTPCAPLAALGLYLRQIDFFAPIRDQVKIAQKQIVHAPLDKLTDAFITILAGAHGLVEANT